MPARRRARRSRALARGLTAAAKDRGLDRWKKSSARGSTGHRLEHVNRGQDIRELGWQAQFSQWRSVYLAGAREREGTYRVLIPCLIQWQECAGRETYIQGWCSERVQRRRGSGLSARHVGS